MPIDSRYRPSSSRPSLEKVAKQKSVDHRPKTAAPPLIGVQRPTVALQRPTVSGLEYRRFSQRLTKKLIPGVAHSCAKLEEW